MTLPHGTPSDPDSPPQRPDPITGEPRPPHAPLREEWPSGRNEADPAKIPPPPPGEGPILEYFRSSRRETIIGAVIGGTIITVATTLSWDGFGWMTRWIFWLIISVTMAILAFVIRTEVFSAGAEWFRRQKKWVRLYELTEVKLTGRPWGRIQLVLRDRENRQVKADLNYLVQNRELWDLVYNGIVHSVHHNQARTNLGARRSLRLPQR